MMARPQSARALSRAVSGLARRGFADAAAPAAGTASLSEEFKSVWKKAAPNLDLPKLPHEFLKARPPVPGTIPAKLTVNFVLPYAVELDGKQVDMVIVPSTAGLMGVLPGHVPTIAELKPGVLSVHEGTEVKQYFVSSGFAFIHPNSVTDIVAIEALPLDRFDPEEVRKAEAEYAQKINTASTELEKAEAQIGLGVYSALKGALGI